MDQLAQHIGPTGGAPVMAAHRGRGSVTIALEGGRLVGLENARGAHLHLLAGQLWITQSDDYRDIIVEPGQSLQLDRDGLALVTAILDSTLMITPGASAMLAQLRFDRRGG